MKNIIEQIIDIDTLAFENKVKNEESLKSKREEYENKLKEYNESNIKKARLEAQRILSQGIDAQNIQDNKILGKIENIDTKYMQIEKQLVSTIFDKLFELED